MKVRSRDGKGLIIDFVLVVAGVMLALAVDEWREESQRDTQTRKVVDALAEEVQRNADELTRSLAYYRSMIPKLKQSIALMRDEGQWQWPEGFDAASEPELTKAAYDSAVITGSLPRFDIETIRALSTLYNGLDTFKSDLQQYGLAIMQTDFNDGLRYLQLMQARLDGVVRHENTLLKRAQAAAAVLEAESTRW